MYSAHLHLLLNHWPIIGTFIALGLFLASLVFRQDQLKQASLALFALIALVSIPAYMSGNGAQEALRKTPEISMDLVETHQGLAFLAFTFMELTGFFALMGVWRYSRSNRNPRMIGPAPWNVAAVLILSVITAGLMSAAGNTGGAIRHPEIPSGQGFISQLEASLASVGTRIIPVITYFVTQYSMWVWPILEDLHFIGLILILGTLGIFNLRILGFFKQLPVAPLHRFIPWGIAGFFINIITGMLFFIGMPAFYTNNIGFGAKMLTIMVAGTNLLLFYCTSAFRSVERVGPGEDAPVSAKLVAASSIILWVVVIVLGRYMPFFEAV